MLNVIAVILESVKSLAVKYFDLFKLFERISITIFTFEYLLRIWACNSIDEHKGSIMGRLKFMISPLAIIDLLSILPFYLPFVIALDLRFIRSIRLFRIFRLFKITRYSIAMRTLEKVLSSKWQELFVTLFIGLILLIITSSLMYFAKYEAQPNNFSSIPSSMWWGVVTLTTVGYGDVYPITGIGKLLGIFTAILGIGMFALPAGILGSGFLDELQNSKSTSLKICPKCGHIYDENLF